MTRAMTAHRNRGRVTLAGLRKLGPNESIPLAAITAYEDQNEAIETVEAARDDAETGWKVVAATVDRQGRDFWRKLIKWYAVARATAPDNLQQALDAIDTGGGYSPARVEKRAKQTRSALSQLPDDFTAAGMTKAALLADIAALLDGFAAVEDLHAAFRTGQANLETADEALDKENKRLYAILAALHDVPGTAEYEVVHGIPTEEAAAAEDEDEEAPQPPPEK